MRMGDNKEKWWWWCVERRERKNWIYMQGRARIKATAEVGGIHSCNSASLRSITRNYRFTELTQWFHDHIESLADAMDSLRVCQLISDDICSCCMSMPYYRWCFLFYASDWRFFLLESYCWMCCYHLISYPSYCRCYSAIVVVVVAEAFVAEIPAHKRIRMWVIMSCYVYNHISTFWSQWSACDWSVIFYDQILRENPSKILFKKFSF